MQYLVTSFYHFATLENILGLKRRLLRFTQSLDIKGTIILAPEGVNATICGMPEAIQNFYNYLQHITQVDNIEYKETFSAYAPFAKMKVKIREEIVSLGVGELNVAENRGEYIEPKDWDAFISRSDVILVDTRNMYETKIGSFIGAIDPETNNFREFPQWVEKNLAKLQAKKVAMYCTGGVRCEKSTAYLKQKGVDAYHLKGGIINYFQMNKVHDKWSGQCFVFDDRVSLDTKLSNANIYCTACNKAVTTDELKRLRANYAIKCQECTTEQKLNYA